MGPGEAILAGFADHFVPAANWPALLVRLEATGDPGEIRGFARPAPDAALAAHLPAIDRLFSAATLREVIAALSADPSPFAAATLSTLREKSPLAAACAFEAIGRARELSITRALALEYRFSWRSAEQGDFVEGIRAAIIDRDRTPRWRHAAIESVTDTEIAAMLAPLGESELRL
jgi:enoyl-CoA hydratase/carnithine racemase